MHRDIYYNFKVYLNQEKQYCARFNTKNKHKLTKYIDNFMIDFFDGTKKRTKLYF